MQGVKKLWFIPFPPSYDSTFDLGNSREFLSAKKLSIDERLLFGLEKASKLNYKMIFIWRIIRLNENIVESICWSSMQYFYIRGFAILKNWSGDDSFRFRANKILKRFKMEKLNCETLIFTRIWGLFVVSMNNNHLSFQFLIRIKFRMNSHECTIENEQMKTFLEYENKYQT